MNIINLTEGFSPVEIRRVTHNPIDDGVTIDIVPYSQKLISFSHYPGGEYSAQLDLDSIEEGIKVIVTTRLNNGEDWLKLWAALSAIWEANIEVSIVYIPYLPASREDRVMRPGGSFMSRMQALLFDTLRLDIMTLDVHSDVVPAMYSPSSIFLKPFGFYLHCVEEILGRDKSLPFALVCPDAGAEKKVNGFLRYLQDHGYKYGEVMYGRKRRDNIEGKLVSVELETPDSIHPMMPVIIIDDICDGGGTFIPLAEQARAAGATDVSLVVTHGIFSKGFSKLEGAFQRIYTTDSIANQYESEYVKVVPFTPFFMEEHLNNGDV